MVGFARPAFYAFLQDLPPLMQGESGRGVRLAWCFVGRALSGRFRAASSFLPLQLQSSSVRPTASLHGGRTVCPALSLRPPAATKSLLEARPSARRRQHAEAFGNRAFSDASGGGGSDEGYEVQLRLGTRALRENQLEKAVEYLTLACETKRGRECPAALSSLCTALVWSGARDAADAVALGAVHRGVYLVPQQRPLTVLRDLPSAPFPDPVALGFPEVRDAIEHLEQCASELMAEMQEDIATCVEVTEAPEGLQDPGAGAWDYTKVHYDGYFGDANFPAVSKLLQQLAAHARVRIESAGVSSVYPGAVIRPHCGPTNACWDLHLGLSVPEPASIQLEVAGETRAWAEGKVSSSRMLLLCPPSRVCMLRDAGREESCVAEHDGLGVQVLLFDDSYEHSVRHGGKYRRTVLDIVIQHPHLARQAAR